MVPLALRISVVRAAQTEEWSRRGLNQSQVERNDSIYTYLSGRSSILPWVSFWAWVRRPANI